MSDVVNPWKSGRAGQCNAVSNGTRCDLAAGHGGYHNGGEGLRGRGQPLMSEVEKVRESHGPEAALAAVRMMGPATPAPSPLLPGQRLAEAVAMPAAIEDARWRWRLRTGGAVSVDMDQRGTVYLHFEAGGFSNVQMMSVRFPELVGTSLSNMTSAWITAREGERVRR